MEWNNWYLLQHIFYSIPQAALTLFLSTRQPLLRNLVFTNHCTRTVIIKLYFLSLIWKLSICHLTLVKSGIMERFNTFMEIRFLVYSSLICHNNCVVMQNYLLTKLYISQQPLVLHCHHQILMKRGVGLSMENVV